MIGRYPRQGERTARSAPGIVLALAVLAAGCGHANSSTPATTSSSPSASPAPSAAPTSSAASAKAQITADWVTFFAGTTPASKKIALLQNGDQFAAVIRAQASSALAKGSAARVSSVTLSGPSSAKVTYTILLGGQPALSDQTGIAVLESGTWKVGQASFCGLLTLEGQHLPQCAASGGSSSPSP